MTAGLVPYSRDPELEALHEEDARLRAELELLRGRVFDPEARYSRLRLEGMRSIVWDKVRRRKAWLRDNGRCAE